MLGWAASLGWSLKFNVFICSTDTVSPYIDNSEICVVAPLELSCGWKSVYSATLHLHFYINSLIFIMRICGSADGRHLRLHISTMSWLLLLLFFNYVPYSLWKIVLRWPKKMYSSDNFLAYFLSHSVLQEESISLKKENSASRYHNVTDHLSKACL